VEALAGTDSDGGQLVRFELLAQLQLGDLARGGVGNLGHEHDIVWRLPLGDLAVKETQQLFTRGRGAGFEHHHHQGAFVPLGVEGRNGGSFVHRRVAHEGVFQLDRADPLAARLDHVLGAVGDVHVAVGVNGGHIAGGEPAIGREG
jgi:hypothetical protein